MKWMVPVYPVAVVLLAFLAVTLKLWATPAVVGEGKPLTTKLAGLTRMLAWVPVSVLVTVSVAVID